MAMERKLGWLRFFLILFGLLFILALYPLLEFVQVGWKWTPPQIEYEQMIVGIYAVMGAFMIIAAKDPIKNLTFIWFVIWVNLVHATIMLFQSLIDVENIAHLYGDVPALYIVSFILMWLTRRTETPDLNTEDNI